MKSDTSSGLGSDLGIGTSYLDDLEKNIGPLHVSVPRLSTVIITASVAWGSCVF